MSSTSPDEPAASGTPPPPGSLGGRTTRGAAVGVLGQAGNQGVRLLGNIVLSRLLFPEAFGLMAIANLVMSGLQMMSNVGIEPALIRHPRGNDPVFLDTAWSLQVLRGVLLFAIGMALAVPVARFYGEPELVRIVPAVTFAAVLMGFFSTKLIRMTRRIQLERVVAIELGGRVAGLIVMVAVALAYRSVWALVVGGLVAAAVRLVLSHRAIPGRRDRFAWDRPAAAEIFAFGKWIFLSTAVTFLALRIDVAMLGKLLPLGALGVYSIGILLPGAIGELSGRLIQTVLMPALSESYRESHARLRENFRRAQQVTLPVVLLALTAVATLAPLFFDRLYDERYADAGWIAQLALLPVWVTFLHESSGRVLLAVGDSRAFALSNVVKMFATGAGCWLGFVLGELPGLIVGGGAGAACGYSVVTWRVSRLGVPSLPSDLRFTALGVLAAVWLAAAPPRLAAVTGRDDLPLWTLACGALLLLPACVLVLRRVLAKTADARAR